MNMRRKWIVDSTWRSSTVSFRAGVAFVQPYEALGTFKQAFSVAQNRSRSPGRR